MDRNTLCLAVLAIVLTVTGSLFATPYTVACADTVASCKLDASKPYKLTDLGTLTPSHKSGYAYSTGINDKGQIVGWSAMNAESWNQHGFLWEAGSGMKDLGTLGTSAGNSAAYSINNKGTIVGWSTDPKDTETRAVIWDSKGGMKDLGTLGGTHAMAYRVNDQGQVVGYSSTPKAGAYHAFLWDKEHGMTDMGTLGGLYSYATDINNLGHAVGYSVVASKSKNHAFFYEEGKGMVDLGMLSDGWHTYASAINDKDQVIGTAYDTKGIMHSFIWDREKGMRDIGNLGVSADTKASDINNFGMIVGSSIIDMKTGESHAFLYQNGEMIDLNNLVGPKSGWVLTGATGINDLGQITGYATDLDGNTHAFLLTLATSSSVPEPASLAVMGIGLVLATNRRWMKTTR